MKEQDRLRNQHMRALLVRDTPDLDGRLAAVASPIYSPGFSPINTTATRPARSGFNGAFRRSASTPALPTASANPPSPKSSMTAGELVPALTERLALTRAQLCALREATPTQTPSTTIRAAISNMPCATSGPCRAAAPMARRRPARPARSLAVIALADVSTNSRSSPPTITEPTPQPSAMPCALSATTCWRPCSPNFNHRAAPTISPSDLRSLSSHTLRPSSIFRRSSNSSPASAAPWSASAAPKAFQQAAHVWHRRAAAVAALRNENQTDRPGWPPLCPPWTSRCGTFEILPLTTAKALVEEGNAHHHCVGTYYDACRSGGTQILSLRAARQAHGHRRNLTGRAHFLAPRRPVQRPL